MSSDRTTFKPPHSTMIDCNLTRKDSQDEARRQQQADKRIRELEKMVKLLAQHTKEAEEIHGIDGQALVDEAEEVLGGKATSITPAAELEEEIERLRSSLASIKRWLHHMPERNRGRRWEEADWHVKNALDGGGDDHAS